MPPIEPVQIILAFVGVVGAPLAAILTWRVQARRRPIEESTAAAANAAALSKASADMITAFRSDLTDFRARIESQESRIDLLESRDRAWSRFYADLHQRWSHHRQQDSAPTIDT